MELIKRILSQMSISKTQLKFLLSLFSTIMVLRGRMNYRNMSRYGVLHEKTFSRNFRKTFDFTDLNHRVIMETIPEKNRKMAAIDASYVPKRILSET
jgi:hypothetical protein